MKRNISLTVSSVVLLHLLHFNSNVGFILIYFWVESNTKIAADKIMKVCLQRGCLKRQQRFNPYRSWSDLTVRWVECFGWRGECPLREVNSAADAAWPGWRSIMGPRRGRITCFFSLVCLLLRSDHTELALDLYWGGRQAQELAPAVEHASESN